jgi:hypothetical protein
MPPLYVFSTLLLGSAAYIVPNVPGNLISENRKVILAVASISSLAPPVFTVAVIKKSFKKLKALEAQGSIRLPLFSLIILT